MNCSIRDYVLSAAIACSVVSLCFLFATWGVSHHHSTPNEKEYFTIFAWIFSSYFIASVITWNNRLIFQNHFPTWLAVSVFGSFLCIFSSFICLYISNVLSYQSADFSASIISDFFTILLSAAISATFLSSITSFFAFIGLSLFPEKQSRTISLLK
jgi:hypothetical protein